MAYSSDQWEKAKAYYEAGKSLAEIKERTGIDRSSISKKAKIQQWKHGANLDIIEAEVKAVEKKSTLNSTQRKVIDEVVNEKLKHIELFQKSALNNQALANQSLKAIHETLNSEKEPSKRAAKAMLVLPALETHGKITERNKNVVVGKEPDVKVDNNVTVNAAQISNVTTQEEAARVYMDLIGKR